MGLIVGFLSPSGVFILARGTAVCPTSKRENVAVIGDLFQNGRWFQITCSSCERRERNKIWAVVSPIGFKMIHWRITLYM